MRLLSLDIAETRWRDLEDAADSTPGIDPWCSGPDWVEPVASAFAPDAEPIVLEEPGVGFALLARHQTSDDGEIIAGLEPLWGFASPILGHSPTRVAVALSEWLSGDSGWDRIILPGLPDDGQMIRALARPLSKLGHVGVAEGIQRQIVNLGDGHDAWLTRRSPAFRRNLRNARRRASTAGVQFVSIEGEADPDQLFERILAIERRSWKGRVDSGIASPEMEVFYRRLLARLHKRGRLRLTIAQMGISPSNNEPGSSMQTGRGAPTFSPLDRVDCGYILGGIRHGRYRGLQLSYTEATSRLSISHLLQSHELQRLATEDVQTYDMGMDMEYKRRWADRAETSVVLVIDRHRV